MSEEYRLRPHHLLNLVTGSEDGYSNLEEGLRKTKLTMSFGELRPYTDDDARISREFYKRIASDPNAIIRIVGGIDDRCRICSNYVGGCTAFFEENLKLEDSRSLNEFPGLNINNVVKVSDILPISTATRTN